MDMIIIMVIIIICDGGRVLVNVEDCVKKEKHNLAKVCNRE